jgi:hypothetical protein
MTLSDMYEDNSRNTIAKGCLTALHLNDAYKDIDCFSFSDSLGLDHKKHWRMV